MNTVTKDLYELSANLTKAGFPNLKIKGQKLIGRPTYRFPDLEELIAELPNASLMMLRDGEGTWHVKTAVFPEDYVKTEGEDTTQYVRTAESTIEGLPGLHEALAKLYILISEELNGESGKEGDDV
jgi:hypothetical protein